jgi:S1-C subfamily serine protease
MRLPRHRAHLYLLVLTVGLLTAFTPVSAGDPKLPADVSAYMQDISVTIRAGFSEGSGVAFARGEQTFVWTAGHVVDGLRRTRKVTDPKTGTPRTIVYFKDAKVIKTYFEDGRSVGHAEMYAEVIRYSDYTHGEDLALLRVRKKNFIKGRAVFFEGKPPKLGTRLLHVGSLLGQFGANSMTDGIMSQHGRLIGEKIFDQTTVTAFPGSSGGMVCLEDGRYVGMLVRGAGEGFNLIVPVRRMRAWAKRAKVEWAIDPCIPVPSKAELKKLPIEDIGVDFGG